MSRAMQKQALQQEAQDRAKLPPLDAEALAELGTDDAARIYRRVSLNGRWLHRYTVYLDNRQMDGKQGFFVLTPLQLANAAHTVLMVQRGWVQRNFEDRTALPVLRHPDGEVVVEGRIAPSPAKLYEFENQLPVGDGLERDWPPIDTGVDMHHGYAFQWFTLSGLVLVLFVWFQIVRRFFLIR